MTTEEVLNKSSGLLGLAEKLARAAWVILAGIVLMAGWVYATNNSIGSLRHDLDQVVLDRQESARWRSDTDKMLARIIAVQENQNLILNRHQAQFDALPMRPLRTQ